MSKSKIISITISFVTIGLKETDLGEEKIEVTIFEPMKLFKLKRQVKGQTKNISILFSNVKHANLIGSSASGKLFLSLVEEVDLSKFGLPKASEIICLSFRNIEEKLFFDFSEVYLKFFEIDSKTMISDTDLNDSKTNDFIRSAIKKVKLDNKTKKDPLWLSCAEKINSVSQKKNRNLIKKVDNPLRRWYVDDDIEHGLE